jgi:hypothetical protein
MKYLLPLTILLFSAPLFASINSTFSVNNKLCEIKVSINDDLIPKTQSASFIGNYKVGFEAFGSGTLKLQGIKVGKPKNFFIPCFKSYITLRFDYATIPFVGELNLLIEYKKAKMDVSILIDNCMQGGNLKNKTCTGLQEKFINNITLR